MLNFEKYKDYDGNGIRIVVLDTGISNEMILKTNIIEKGIGIYSDENESPHLICDAEDDIGHGTAVISILTRKVPKAEIIPIKVIFDGIMTHEETLIYALNYIEKNIDCDIVHISIGLQFCENKGSLYSACEKLYSKGVIIVSAFDNGGILSYPAAFECVIGIDSEIMYGKYEYARTNSSIINYVADSCEIRVKWLEGKSQMVSGNSFVAPEFSAFVAQIIQSGIRDFFSILEILDENAETTIEYNMIESSKMNLNIEKAITFPFNKEIHSLARFQSELKFEIVGFYDSKYTGNVNRKLNEILMDANCENSIYVKNIDDLDWNSDFDTVILGHVSMLSSVCKQDYLSNIIDMCKKYKKQLYALWDIRENKALQNSEIKYYIPCVEYPSSQMLPKTYCIGKPVLGIVGTASRQGKFSLQIKLRLKLRELGYKVGFLSTEPTGLLLGADEVYPIGFEGTVKSKGLMSIHMINQLLGKIEENQPDIILFGSQSQTIPNDSGGLKQYPVAQNELILACQADAYILCVSSEDSLDYVKRTIAYLEAVYPSKVVCLALSPLKQSLRWSVLSHKKNMITKDEEKCAIKKFESLDIPVYLWSDNIQLDSMVQTCIDYFSE